MACGGHLACTCPGALLFLVLQSGSICPLFLEQGVKAFWPFRGVYWPMKSQVRAQHTPSHGASLDGHRDTEKRKTILEQSNMLSCCPFQGPPDCCKHCERATLPARDEARHPLRSQVAQRAAGPPRDRQDCRRGPIQDLAGHHKQYHLNRRRHHDVGLARAAHGYDAFFSHHVKGTLNPCHSTSMQFSCESLT